MMYFLFPLSSFDELSLSSAENGPPGGFTYNEYNTCS